VIPHHRKIRRTGIVDGFTMKNFDIKHYAPAEQPAWKTNKLLDQRSHRPGRWKRTQINRSRDGQGGTTSR
jgi:hypothetical protein